MSEDTLDLSYSVVNEKYRQSTELVEAFCHKLNLACPPPKSDGSVYSFNFYGCDVYVEFLDALDELHRCLLSLGVKEITSEVFYNDVGESDYYKSYADEIKRFASLDDMRSFEIERQLKFETSSLAFSSNNLLRTALIRFFCPDVDQIQKIMRCFSVGRDSEGFLGRKILEQGLVDASWDLDVDKIIGCIDFVSHQGEYLFVGCDLTRVAFFQKCMSSSAHKNGFIWWDDFENRLINTVDALALIDGVQSVLIKYRLSGFPNEEYIIKNSEGFRSQNLTLDDNWIFPANYTDQDGQPV